MRVFLLALLAVIVVGTLTSAGLERFASQNAADAFTVAGSARISPGFAPDPNGTLSHPHAPAGGITSGRSPAGRPPP